jgi:predicted RNA-binding Zn-ribbon protein involved in translation (DUF1610 family)
MAYRDVALPKLKPRRGRKDITTVTNPVLEAGELFLELDTRRIKVGDGVTPYNELPYFGTGNSEDKISLIHNCTNCGAQLEVEENKPIFHCKYCGSTYVIGTAQVRSHY